MKRLTRHPLLFVTTLASFAAVAYGCKDFLTSNATPQGALDAQVLYTKAGVEGSLIAAYRVLDCANSTQPNWGCAVSNWVWGSVTSDDAYKGSEASDQPAINDIEAYHWSTADAESYLDAKWRAVYEGVVRTNSTIRLLKKVVAAKPIEISTADQNGIEGEALFLRAHYHFEAWRVWGRIPYYADPNDTTDFRHPNLTSQQAITAILADLNAAIAKLPATPRNSQAGRATSWTAKAYKGRVQLYAANMGFGTYADALTTLRDVRNSGPYALESSYDKVWTGFPTLQNGKETIFAYQASANDGEPNGENANYGERLNFPHSGSHFGCCGFHQPSQNLVNFYAVDAAGLPLALTNANWNANNNNFTANLTTAVDPRLDWTVGRDGVPFKDWGVHEAGWIRAPAYGGNYSAKKNVHERASGAESSVGWVNTQLNSVNIHVFRYADLLLMLAEAEIEAGSLTNAMTIVNEIRTRAGVRAQGCGLPTDAAAQAKVLALYPTCAGHSEMAVPLTDATIRWATYRVGLYTAAQFASQASARTAVQYERRLEMGMEGQRFFDLKRWGQAITVLNAYLAVEKTRRPYLTGAEAFATRHLLFPIPAIQIELSRVGSENRLTQNTGW
jgi:hypothetical protein